MLVCVYFWACLNRFVSWRQARLLWLRLCTDEPLSTVVKILIKNSALALRFGDALHKLALPFLHSGFWLEFARIAQLAEQLICNQQVVGSNPSAGSNILGNNWAKSVLWQSDEASSGASFLLTIQGVLYKIARSIFWRGSRAAKGGRL